MISFATVLEAVLPVYLLAGAGVTLRKLKLFPSEMDDGLLRLIIHFLYPCLILDKVLGNELLLSPSVVGWGIGVGFGMIIVGFSIAWLVSRLLGMERGSGSRSFTLAGGLQNFGYTAIPVLMVLFVTEQTGDRVLGVLFVHNLGVDLAIWAVGVMILTGQLLKSVKVLFNGPLIAILLGLLGVYSGAGRFFDPQEGPLIGSILRTSMSWLGGCAFPMALILIGATIGDLFGKERINWKVAAGAILVRNVVMAFLFLCAAKYLPLITELKQVLVVQAGMPAAVTPILLARVYGGKPQVAMQVVMATSLGALLTMPLIVAWGEAWVF